MARDAQVVSDLLRAATLEDAEEILGIYAYYVEKTAITFETETPSIEEFRERMTKVMAKYPYLVIERGGEIVGFAYAGMFKERLAYRWTLESTIYLKHGVTGGGLGKNLYTELLLKLRALNILSVLGVIAVPNAASVALHEKLGFKKIGIMPKVGYKFDQWWDVGIWQLDWDKPLVPPEVKNIRAI